MAAAAPSAAYVETATHDVQVPQVAAAAALHSSLVSRPHVPLLASSNRDSVLAEAVAAFRTDFEAAQAQVERSCSVLAAHGAVCCSRAW